MYPLNSLKSTSLMLLLLLHPETPHDHVSFPYITGFDISLNLRRIQTTRSRTHHIVIIVIIVIVVLLILCYFITSHVTVILFYHASMRTLQHSFMSRVLWLS
jgi:hypothetical protein